MQEFAHLLSTSEDWLVERVQSHARHTTIMRMAWQASIAGLSSAMLQVLPGGVAAVDLAPDDAFQAGPVEAFAVQEVRQHRARGVSLGMFLGLLPHYRQGYLDLVEGGGLEPGAKTWTLHFVSRFFDRLNTAIAVEWNLAGETARLEEMRAETQRALHEKQRLSAVFQALPNPVILLDPEGRVLDLNETAHRWLDQAGPEHGGGAEDGPARRAFYLGQDVGGLLPWVAPALQRMRQGDRSGQTSLIKSGQGESLSFLDTRVFPLLGVSGGFEGMVVVIQDVSALRDSAEAQARIASELRGQLREASSLNRLAEVLGRPVDSVEELLENMAAALAQCWDFPGGVEARISFDGRVYSSGDEGVCGDLLEEPLTVLGRPRGVLTLCSRSAERPFPASDAAPFASIARQLEHVLGTRLTLTLLGQSEKQFREFFNNAADAIFIHEPDGRILDANRNAGLWLNLPTESLAGKNLLNSLVETDRDAVAARFTNALGGAPELFQATFIRRDGFTVPAEMLCQAQDFQGRTALVSSGRNITSRLRDQAEIEHRLELEAMISRVSGRLINTGGEDISPAMEESLGDICRFTGMRQATVFLGGETKNFVLAFQWREAGLPGLPRNLRRFGQARMPWLVERIAAGERVVIRHVAHMPPAHRKERELLAQAGIVSLAAVPMTVKDRLLGVLVLSSDQVIETARLSGSRLLDPVTLLFANAIERRRASLALRESESLARAILDALPANICVLDKKGVLTMVNRSWNSSGPESTPLGGEGARLALGGNYLEACRAAADNPHAAQALEGILGVLAGKAASFRLEYPGRQGGAQRWYVMQVTPFAQGKAGAVISHRDITERMRAILEMRESEERFRLIVETAQEGILMVNTETRITYANPRLQSLLGYSQDELLNRSITDFLDPQDLGLLQQKLKRRRQGLADQYELRLMHKNGQRIYTMVNASPVTAPDGAIIGSIGMITDISDRVRANARLRRNEARYRSLVESMHEGLLMTRRGGVIAYVNNRFCLMLGRRKGELVGRPAMDFAENDSKKRLAAMLSGQHRGDGPEEILWEHESGRHVYTLVSPSSFADEEGKPAGFFAVVTDTTERKGLESQLLQSQKLEAIGQLAAGIAHEINTPAQYVGNNVQFIKGAFESILAVCGKTRQFMQAARDNPPTQEGVQALAALMAEHDIDYLEAEVPSAIAQTLEGVERISTIVRSVKQFAHPASAAMSTADLNEAMLSTVTVSRNEWKYVAGLETDLDPDMPPVVCMIGEINQVVLNLIINAAHAIADAQKENPGREGRIVLSTRHSPPWAEIRVSDSGTGIPKAVQAKIFDPFFTTKEVGRGTGQGLTISRSIVVEKHHGQLFFETEPGQGTTFVVRLPLEQNKEVQP